MTRTPFDLFSKQFLEEFLSPLGRVNVNREVPGESRWIDVWFEPSPPPTIDPETLGLLGRIAATPCLIEAFRNQPSVIVVCNCKHKLFGVFGELQREAEREHRTIPDSLVGFPWLWILTPSASVAFLERLNLIAAADWPLGVYFDRANHTALIAINQLPVSPDTLWIRLLGKGKAQQQAIAEVLSFTRDDPRRGIVLQLLVTWRISLLVNSAIEQEEQEIMVQLSQAYLEWEQRTEQRGLERGLEQGLEQERSLILRLLKCRVGELPGSVHSQVSRLSVSELETLAEALLNFSGLPDLEQWLDRNRV
jgi:Domain of unknown function (DUF4351)